MDIIISGNSIRQNIKLLSSQPQVLEEFIATKAMNAVVKRLDYEISVLYGISDESYNKGISIHLKGLVAKYMSALSDLGHLRKFGNTTNLLDFLLVYPELNINYLWIPKNASTFIKVFFMSLHQDKAVQISKGRIHENMQKKFGVSIKDFLSSLEVIMQRPTIVIIRHPLERLVSCYIDKFAKPVWLKKPFELWVRRYIEHRIIDFKLKDRKIEQSITFREFCYLILYSESVTLDNHWRPQSHFIPEKGFRKLIFVDFKNLSNNLAQVLHKLNPKIAIPSGISREKKNQSVKVGVDMQSANVPLFTDKLPQEINPEKANLANYFFDNGLFFAMAKFYGDDLKLYNKASEQNQFD